MRRTAVTTARIVAVVVCAAVAAGLAHHGEPAMGFGCALLALLCAVMGR